MCYMVSSLTILVRLELANGTNASHLPKCSFLLEHLPAAVSSSVSASGLSLVWSGLVPVAPALPVLISTTGQPEPPDAARRPR